MHYTLLFSIIGIATSIPIEKQTNGFVGLPVVRNSRIPEQLLKRDEKRSENESPEIDMKNNGAYYEVELELGSPPQKISMLLDTGSSDTWVDANTSHSNHFDYTKSSTFDKNNTDAKFSIGYGDSSHASGFWATDKISLFENPFVGTFGVATDTNAQSSVMGLGLTQGEMTVTTVDTDGILSPTYPNFPQLLKNNGLIHRVAYSMWLQDESKANGAILFGGVDHSKYSGNLALLPIVNDHSISVAKSPTTLSVMLHGANLTQSNKDFSIQFATPVLLDSGSTLCQLPSSFVDELGQSLGGIYSDSLEVYEVNCAAQGLVNFNLSGVNIPVEVSDLILPSNILKSSQSQGCVLGVYKTDTAKHILGDGFLRNAYVVFDLEGLQVGIAPSKNETIGQDTATASGTSIEAITTGIPNATSAPLYSHTDYATASSSST